ncbi:MAG: polyprenol monophosphomannose synthase [Desulfobacterales bacterium]|nr:polyprenol monophosphomannose synthase [Desulfobacterales bacterium]
MKGLVIIPTFNEVDNIALVVAKTLEADPGLDILIIDDNSPDGTGTLADSLADQQPRVHVLHRPRKLGLGTAYIAGFKYAVNRKYDLIFEMDADLSHDPKYLPDFIEAATTADLVIGSRYLNGVNVVNWPMHRLLLSYLANIYARLITGMSVRDLTSGFKCFRREVLESLDLTRISSEGYAFQVEIHFRVWKKGFVLREIPIVFTDRTCASTKMDSHVIVEAVWIVWKMRLLALAGKL